MRPWDAVSLPFDDGPLPTQRCGVCDGWRYRPVPPPESRVTYAVLRQRWLKIGMTGNLRERLGVLRRSTEGCITLHPPEMAWRAPLSLIAVIEGDIEHELHERFADAHDIGEWFRLDNDALRDWAFRAMRVMRATDAALLPSEAAAYVGMIGEDEALAMEPWRVST